ncbi:hypothetical protein ACWDA7_39245 [Streptomyces sp. NPDC001156]
MRVALSIREGAISSSTLLKRLRTLRGRWPVRCGDPHPYQGPHAGR